METGGPGNLRLDDAVGGPNGAQRTMTLPDKVTVVEVGPRDGFQMEEAFIPTETKVAIINQLTHAGIRRMEVTSFVSPKVISQLRDAAEVLAAIERGPSVTYLALVPNLKGAERAIAAGADGVKVVICTSETYNRRNVGMSVDESIENCAAILKLAQAKGKNAEVVIGLAFGCPLEGPIPEARVIELTRRLVSIGFREISIADSMGLANPIQTRRMMRHLQDAFDQIHFSLHVHNTRGLGLTNILTALEEGIDMFDSSIGGLGGSAVVVSGAGGNVSTEDLVNMLNEMDIETGVDVEGVMAASRIAQDFLGRALPSYVLSAGTPAQFYRRIKRSEAVKSTLL